MTSILREKIAFGKIDNDPEGDTSGG